MTNAMAPYTLRTRVIFCYLLHSKFFKITICTSDSGHAIYQFNGCVSGSGRVTFSSYKSYVKAVSAAFVEIKTAKFTKKVKWGSLAHRFIS